MTYKYHFGWLRTTLSLLIYQLEHGTLQNFSSSSFSRNTSNDTCLRSHAEMLGHGLSLPQGSQDWYDLLLNLFTSWWPPWLDQPVGPRTALFPAEVLRVWTRRLVLPSGFAPDPHSCCLSGLLLIPSCATVLGLCPASGILPRLEPLSSTCPTTLMTLPRFQWFPAPSSQTLSLLSTMPSSWTLFPAINWTWISQPFPDNLSRSMCKAQFISFKWGSTFYQPCTFLTFSCIPNFGDLWLHSI